MNEPRPMDLGLDTRHQRDLEFIYVGDPMCSWCWGFAPAVERLEARYGLPLRIVMGGLRTGPQAQVMDAAAREQLATYWEGVAHRTGQPFTTASLERAGWRYDTEPSCRAVVTMRELAPQDTVRWLARLHRSFYVDGVDLTDPTAFPDLLEGFDVDPDRFTATFAADATIEQTIRDFESAQRLGATGFPTVLFRDGEELGIVTQGFVPWEQLEPALTAWLQERYAGLIGDEVCDAEAGRC